MLRALGGAGVTGAAGLAGLSGCSWLGSDPPPPPPPDPLEPLLAGAGQLADRYQAAITAHPRLAARLRPLREAHLAHQTALREVIGRPEPATTPPGSGTWAPPLDAPQTGPAEPEQPEQALADLRKAERDGEQAAAQACLAAPPERATLLGSIAAARAAHRRALA